MVSINGKGLQDLVSKTTWICRICLAKGAAAKIATRACDTTRKPFLRLKWWSQLDSAQKQKLADNLSLSNSLINTFDEKAAEAIKNSKPHKRPSPCDADHREMLKKTRAIWRKQHNLCQDKQKVSGAGNMQLTLIPVVNKQTLPHGEPTESPTRTDDKERKSTSAKQEKPRGISSCDKSKNNSNGSSTSFRTDLDSWQKDLTQEGIEPNPGPKIWQINIRGFNLRRDILYHALAQNVQAILLCKKLGSRNLKPKESTGITSTGNSSTPTLPDNSPAKLPKEESQLPSENISRLLQPKNMPITTANG